MTGDSYVTSPNFPDSDGTFEASSASFLGGLKADVTILQSATGAELRFQTGVFTGYQRFSDVTVTDQR